MNIFFLYFLCTFVKRKLASFGKKSRKQGLFRGKKEAKSLDFLRVLGLLFFLTKGRGYGKITLYTYEFLGGILYDEEISIEIACASACLFDGLFLPWHCSFCRRGGHSGI
jgi:hypothetical protein